MCLPLLAAIPALMSAAGAAGAVGTAATALGASAAAASTISTVATVAGAALSAAGAIQQGKQQSAIANAQANAADVQARQAIEAGRQDEQNFRMKTSQQQSQKVAEMAANGLDTSSGSALSVAGDISALGETDALRIRRSAYDTASGYGTQAAIYRQSAKNAEQSGLLGAASSLLSGTGTVAKQWYNLG